MKRSLFTGVLLLCIPLALSGCWDRTEINDVAFVIGSAVDKEKGLYRSTLQIALPGNLGGSGSEGGGGGTEGNKSYYLESKTGLTLRNSNMEVQAGNSRNLSFAHRRTLLLGDDFARGGIASMLDQFARIPQNRLSSLVAVTEGPAYKILDASAPMEQFPSEMVRELMNQFTKRPVTIKYLANDLLSEGIDVSLPYISLQEAVPEGEGQPKKNIQITGMALFKEDKLVGVLRGQEVRMINLAMNQATSPDVLVSGPNGNGYVTIRFTENVTSLKPVIHGDDITMHISILAKGSVIENNSDYSLGGEKNMSKLEQSASKEIIRQIHSGMRLLQDKYHSDALGFGRAILQKDPHAWARLKNHWDEVYPTVKVVIDTNLHVENIGAVNKPFGRKDKELKND
ncbi:Ger(x)C family spore germination protein [Paenibacillus sp. HJL G12]|uniref:Ger(X)C family spore germination protein n=1 Tax=Paenibacillus dendrobii TaxID=2691084 RepID=A0A7X3IM66_9BACL|nr:Ger(x)C family spore germination protein [Paenibacillus dendrobii]MWV46509.1 Ger(x)C family spore germination protein [Paenibacillus dendrobii]